MSGRNRINKGSNNFKNFTLISKNLLVFIKYLIIKFYVNLLTIFEKFLMI